MGKELKRKKYRGLAIKMGRTLYRCNPETYKKYFLDNQHGGEFFRGVPVQKGHGAVGSLIGSAFRKLLPLVARIGKPLLKRAATHAIKAGTNVASDVFFDQSKPLAALKKRSKDAVKGVVIDSIRKQRGSGKIVKRCRKTKVCSTAKKTKKTRKATRKAPKKATRKRIYSYKKDIFS